MKDQETMDKFIERRAQGLSFVRIASELGDRQNLKTGHLWSSLVTFGHDRSSPTLKLNSGHFRR